MKLFQLISLLISILIMLLTLLIPQKINLMFFISCAIALSLTAFILSVFHNKNQSSAKSHEPEDSKKLYQANVNQNENLLKEKLKHSETKYQDLDSLWKTAFVDLEKMYHTANELLLYTELEEDVIKAESTAINSVVREFETINETNQKVGSQIERLSTSSTQVRQNSNESFQRMKKTNNIIVEISKSNIELKNSIQQFVENTRKIENFLSNISNIANKTRTLSINAAIEASKSGSEGAGFAVLAREIRTLAENTGGYAKNINQLLGLIQNNSNKVITSMDDSSKKVKQGMQLFEETSQYMRGLEEEIGSFDSVIQNIEEVVQVSMKEISNTFQTVSLLKDSSKSTNENTTVLSEKSKHLSELAEITINQTINRAGNSKVGRLVELLKVFREKVQNEIEGFLKEGAFLESELFNPHFSPDAIHETRFDCKYQPYLDKKLCPMIDEIKKNIPGVLNIVILDMHLYSVTGGSQYNQALTGNTEHDAKINFIRFKYDDNPRAVKLSKAVQNPDSVYLSSYPLKGFKMAISDVVLPIFIRGKKWGVLRTGFNPMLLE